MDQKVTNQNVLAELDDRGITWLTLRMRSTALNQHIRPARRRLQHRPPGPRRQIPTTPRRRRNRHPVQLPRHRPATRRHRPRPGRRDRHHHQRPDLHRQTTHRAVRPPDEHRTTPRRIHPVLPHRRPRRVRPPQRRPRRRPHRPRRRRLRSPAPRLTGYHHATPDTLQRRFLSTTGTITNTGDTTTVHLDRRTYSPILRQADIPDTTIPWWQGRRLRLQFA